jgi:hypothetical protein
MMSGSKANRSHRIIDLRVSRGGESTRNSSTQPSERRGHVKGSTHDEVEVDG